MRVMPTVRSSSAAQYTYRRNQYARKLTRLTMAGLVALVAILDDANREFLDFHLFPRMERGKRFFLPLSDSWLGGRQLLALLEHVPNCHARQSPFGRALQAVESEVTGFELGVGCCRWVGRLRRNIVCLPK